MRMARLNSAVATGRRMNGAEMGIVGNPASSQPYYLLSLRWAKDTSWFQEIEWTVCSGGLPFGSQGKQVAPARPGRPTWSSFLIGPPIRDQLTRGWPCGVELLPASGEAGGGIPIPGRGFCPILGWLPTTFHSAPCRSSVYSTCMVAVPCLARNSTCVVGGVPAWGTL